MKLSKHLLTFLLLLASSSTILAQPVPVSATLQRNNVRATVQSNGALFLGGEFITAPEAGQPENATIYASGLWLGGVDPAGNLKLAAQLYNENGKSDFAAGLYHPQAPDAPPMNKIWRVTREQVLAHIADFQDNGAIDNPIPEVFAWPATGNAFFEAYNPDQPALTSTSQGLAGYWDRDGTGTYDPDRGDHPVLPVRNCVISPPIIPNEMLWFTFHDQTPHTQSLANRLDVEVQATVFSYGCLEPDNPLNNTVFVHYKLISHNVEHTDDMFFGAFTDFDIGNPNDDFMGCDTSRNLIFAYNGDAVDEGAYGTTAPAMALQMLRGPLSQFGEELSLAHIMPFEQGSGINGTPQNAVEYYRLLTGSRRDGVPLEAFGSNYPGDPNDPNSDSEVSAGNAPGDRRVVSSYGPFRLQPGAVNEIILGYTYTQSPDATPLQNVADMYGRADIVQAYFDNCFENFQQSCSPVISATDEFSGAGFDMKVMPNPAINEVLVQLSDAKAQRLVLYDVIGKKVMEVLPNNRTSEWRLSVGHLPAGMYWLKVQDEHGAFATTPLVIVK